MDDVRVALDRLDRESKELISAAQQAACDAVLKHQVLPSHVALALAQRFTPERIHDSFPALCLVDALVQLSRAAVANGSGAGGDGDGDGVVTAEAAAAKAMLDVLWKSAPSLFTAYRSVQDDGMLRKAERLVRRWGARKLITNTLEGQLLAAMAKSATGPELTTTTTTSAGATASTDASGSASVGAPVQRTTPPPSSTTAKLSLTQQELEVMTHTLRNCLAIMERLPMERAYLYVQLLEEEGTLAPSLLPTALTALQSLWGDLQRDDFVLAARGLGSAAAGPGQRGGAQSMTGGGGNGSGETATSSASTEAMAALGQLFERLATAEGGASSGMTAASSASASAAAHLLPPALAAPAPPIRYVAPLLSDTLAVQSLQQRPGGYGPLLPRKVTGGAGGSGYYPRFSPLCVSRRFRPRAGAAGGGARSQQRAFPTAQEWIGTADMEKLALIVDSAEVAPTSRKRERE